MDLSEAADLHEFDADTGVSCQKMDKSDLFI